MTAPARTAHRITDSLVEFEVILTLFLAVAFSENERPEHEDEASHPDHPHNPGSSASSGPSVVSSPARGDVPAARLLTTVPPTRMPAGAVGGTGGLLKAAVNFNSQRDPGALIGFEGKLAVFLRRQGPRLNSQGAGRSWR
jgi:hypothetical protein